LGRTYIALVASLNSCFSFVQLHVIADKSYHTRQRATAAFLESLEPMANILPPLMNLSPCYCAWRAQQALLRTSLRRTLIHDLGAFVGCAYVSGSIEGNEMHPSKTQYKCSHEESRDRRLELDSHNFTAARVKARWKRDDLCRLHM